MTGLEAPRHQWTFNDRRGVFGIWECARCPQIRTPGPENGYRLPQADAEAVGDACAPHIDEEVSTTREDSNTEPRRSS